METKNPTQPQKPAAATQPKPAVGKSNDPLSLARAARVAESARREKLPPETRFKEDIVAATNRVAAMIDGQRGSLYGIIQRGLSEGVLEPESVEKALDYIDSSISGCRDLLAEESEAKGFKL